MSKKKKTQKTRKNEEWLSFEKDILANNTFDELTKNALEMKATDEKGKDLRKFFADEEANLPEDMKMKWKMIMLILKISISMNI